MPVTFEVSQVVISELKFVQLENIATIFTTFEVSHSFDLLIVVNEVQSVKQLSKYKVLDKFGKSETKLKSKLLH
jgi:proteasome assembly chaperone (PAC2) family protein